MVERREHGRVARAVDDRETGHDGAEGRADEEAHGLGDLGGDADGSDGCRVRDQADDELVGLGVHEHGHDADLELDRERDQFADLRAGDQRGPGGEQEVADDPDADQDAHGLLDERGLGESGQPVPGVQEHRRGDQEDHGGDAGGDRRGDEALEPRDDVREPAGEQRQQHHGADDAEHVDGVVVQGRGDVEEVDDGGREQHRDDRDEDADRHVHQRRGPDDARRRGQFVAAAGDGHVALHGRPEARLGGRDVHERRLRERPHPEPAQADIVQRERDRDRGEQNRRDRVDDVRDDVAGEVHSVGQRGRTRTSARKPRSRGFVARPLARRGCGSVIQRTSGSTTRDQRNSDAAAWSAGA